MNELKLCAFADEASKYIDGQIEALSRHGIRLLEIRGVDGTNISSISNQKAKEVRAKLDDAGICVWSVGSPLGKIKITDDFTQHLECFKHTIELSHILGAKHLRMFSFYVPSGEADLYTEEVMGRLAEMCRASLGSGITLCHENEKGIFGDTAKRCELIHRTLPEIKAVFDPANFIQCGVDTKEAWELLYPYIEYMHIKDALSDGKVVKAGDGIGSIPYLVSKYDREVLTLEPHLTVFSGLSALEGDEKTKIDEHTYPSADVAFDAAVGAIKAICGMK